MTESGGVGGATAAPGTTSESELLLTTLAAVAPGTPLRDALERILRGRTGALVVLGHDAVVEQLCSGGFTLDVPFAATRLRELAKMDGAVICDAGVTKILRAAVQLVPDPTIETSESGTRHRTAERVAKQTGLPVVSVSASMNIVALYIGGTRHVLEGSETILARGNQALATLERYRARLDEVTGTLSALEIEDLVTVRDVSVVVQRQEMVRRISEEISGYVVELGSDGRLLSLQLDELVGGIGADRALVVRDYLLRPAADAVAGGAPAPTSTPGGAQAAGEVLADLAALHSSTLVDLTAVARVLHLATDVEGLDGAVSPRGYRLLSKVPRLPPSLVTRLVEHYDGLQKLLAATTEDLLAVGGVGDQRARSIREGLSRLAESSILERYV